LKKKCEEKEKAVEVTDPKETGSAIKPTAVTMEPTHRPTDVPTGGHPTEDPTPYPTEKPSAEPTEAPTTQPTTDPSEVPTAEPTAVPTVTPTKAPIRGIKYIGSLSNSKAHPYVYPSRSSAAAACRKSGYKGLCSRQQVDGFQVCGAGWMTDYKGYWMSKTVRGCGSGRGFRSWGAGSVGAYCCDAIKYIGSLTNPKAHPYVYPSRSSATKACRKSGYAGLCSKKMVDGYERCAAGWMTDYKGYWMSKTVRGCGSGRGMRGWGAGKVGAYCCTTK